MVQLSIFMLLKNVERQKQFMIRFINWIFWHKPALEYYRVLLLILFKDMLVLNILNDAGLAL